MIGKIEREKEKYHVILNQIELQWYGINTEEPKTYVQAQILGVNKKPLETPIPFFTQIYKNSENERFLSVSEYLLKAYGLKKDDIIRFHLHNIKHRERKNEKS